MPDISGQELTEEEMVTLRSAIASRAVTDPWAKKAIHAALKAGRVDELWPGATFERVDQQHSSAAVSEDDWDGRWGRLQFANGGRAKINFKGA